MKFFQAFKNLVFNLLYIHLEKIFFLLRFRSLNSSPPSHKRSGINYAGYLGSEKGLGEAARSVIRIIQKSGVPLALNNIEHRWQKDVEGTFVSLYQSDNPYTMNILHVNADLVPYVANCLGKKWFQGRYNVGYWFWELEEFPRKWASSFRCFDEIWTATEFCKNSVESISPVPVRVMPLSIEVALEGQYDRNMFGLKEGSMVFLFVFDLMSHFERKNPLAVISSFRQAFEGKTEEEVTLVLKFTGHDKDTYEAITRACEGLPVRLFDSYMERDRLYGLMSVCDCYVSLHRSEGFGLTLAEAMCLGKPVIATAYSGNIDFMNESNSFPVSYRMRRIERSSGPYKKGLHWADPDVAHAAEIMQKIYADPAMARDKGLAASRYMHEHFSPASLSHRLEALHKEIGSARG